ncbi:MAG: ATPase, partial [Gammaproteobacteria bacterium]|nr:ATPase [Gammaproteobacteria bacterium]
QIFFFFLPTPEVRLAIFRIHLGKRGQDESRFDLNELVTLSEGFTGAEIEQTVVSALYSARAATKALDSELLRQEIERTKPLSILMAEKIAYLRAWAADRTVSAE